MDAAESQALFNYIVKKEYPLNFTKDEKRRLREKSGSFCVSRPNADLIHIGADNKRTRVIVQNEEKNHLIETIHEGIGGGYFGQSATILSSISIVYNAFRLGGPGASWLVGQVGVCAIKLQCVAGKQSKKKFINEQA